MIPTDLEKRFEGAVKRAVDRERYLFYESNDEKIKRLMNQLGIQKHGKGKRKKKRRKKGGK